MGKKVVTVTAVEQGGGPRDGLFDDRVIDEGITAAGLAAGLTGRPVKSVHRQGKQIWLTFGGGGGGGRGGGESLLFHHGMTGCLKVKGQSSIKYARDTTKDGGEVGGEARGDLETRTPPSVVVKRLSLRFRSHMRAQTVPGFPLSTHRTTACACAHPRALCSGRLGSLSWSSGSLAGSSWPSRTPGGSGRCGCDPTRSARQ